MKFWSFYNNIKKVEDKRIAKAHLERMRKRVKNNKVIGVKRSLIIILRGLISAIALTIFEYLIKNPNISNSNLLKVIFNIGFFISGIGVLQFFYGFYHLIKSVFAKLENDVDKK